MRRMKTSVALICVLASVAGLSLALASAGSAEQPACQPSTSTSTSTTTSTTPSPPPMQPPQGQPLNNVTVENCIDGTIQARSKVQVGSTSGDTSAPANFAYAYAHDCGTPATVGCGAVAAAFQVVLVPKGTPVQTPQNVAEAVNYNCDHCAVFAFADQYAVNVPPGTRLSTETRRAIARIRREAAQDVADPSLTFVDLDTRLKALAADEHQAVDDGLAQHHLPEFHKHSSEHVKQLGQRS